MLLLPADVNEFSEEIREASPGNLLFKIESFSLLKNRGLNSYELGVFEAGGYFWKLIVDFGGNDEDDDCYLSAFLSIVESESLPVGWEVNAVFTFFVHNQILGNYLSIRGRTRRFNASNPKWGFSKLMSMESLMDPCKGYVVDDVCVFGGEVFVVRNDRIYIECFSLIDGTARSKRDWKILGFSKLGNVWFSEEFFVGNRKWKVQMYPNGDHRAIGRYMSIFVECVDSKKFETHQEVKAEVHLCFKNQLNVEHCSRNFTHWFTSSMDHWGFAEFMPIADLRDPEKGFLVGDCCVLGVEICAEACLHDAPQ